MNTRTSLFGVPSRTLMLTVAASLALVSMLTIQMELPRISREHGLWDFGAFIASGRAAASGLDPYGIYPPLTPHVVFPGFESWNPNLNPPISALLFQAFDLADPPTALRSWTIVSVGCYLASVSLLLWRYCGGIEAAVLGLWSLGLAGFWDTLYLGQIYTPLVLAAVGAWLLLERRRWVWAGLLIGLVVSLKPNFLVWPVLLFLAGYRLTAIATAATAAVIAAIPLAVFGSQIYVNWLTLVAGDGARAIFLTNASIAGLAARAGMPFAGTIISLFLLAALAAWAFLRRPGLMRVSSIALVASVLASPLGWIHYTLFLLPVLLHHWQKPWSWIAGLALTVPVPVILAHFGKPVWQQLTLGSLYGWALLLMLIALITDEWRRPCYSDERR